MPATIRILALALTMLLASPAALAQPPDAAAGEADAGPLPDIPALMQQVEVNQRTAEAIEKTYIYHSVAVQQELDRNGHVKKTTTTESDHFWLNGVPVRKIIRKDGRDLTPDELAKEDKRIDKEVRDARDRRAKLDAEGKPTDPRGDEEVTVSRILELGSFSNPRRVLLNARPTIAADYTGDPHARTRNRAEGVIRELAGTVWVDEQDRVLVRAEGHFTNDFKIGGGLLADIRKGTHFTLQQTRVNGEVWLPAHIEAEGAARALLVFGFNGRIEIAYSDYRKFRTTTTILPVTPTQTPAMEPEH